MDELEAVERACGDTKLMAIAGILRGDIGMESFDCEGLAEDVESLRAALRTLREMREGQGWRLIETAPKDGTTILAWWYWEPNDAVTVRWDDDYRSWVDTSREIYHPPSHWMPLPDPPALPHDNENKGDDA